MSVLKWDDVLKLSGAPLSPPRRVEKTEEEWSALLSTEQFRVLRDKGTERPFSSKMCSLFEAGIYACAGCGTTLFDASQKFDSYSGWPSFTQPVEANVVAYHSDTTLARPRVETTCAVCDGHLGHVFPDGPKEAGGLRYCINAVSLTKL
ncbi:MAG: peptide-methionine (R)-S-oxide reductase MsrB [Polyangiales bacterium]